MINPDIVEQEKKRKQGEQTAAAAPAQPTPVQEMMRSSGTTVDVPKIPSWFETQQKIVDTYQTDPTRAAQMFKSTMQLASIPGSPLYRPYTQATNTMSINALAELGIDMSGGVNDAWFQKYSYLKDGATYGVNNTITKGKTPASQAAYYYNQLWNDEATTKAAEREVQALIAGVQYWATQRDRNYSAEEIIAKVYNAKTFPTIAKMMAAKESGTSVPLNRAVDFDLDMLNGYIWQAWNNGGTGNIMADSISYINGYGNTWQDNAALREQLHSNPYASGSTLDDARMYYGVSGFSDDFLEKNPVVDQNDDTELKMRQQVYDATVRTNETLKQLADFQKDLDAAISNKTDASKVDVDGLLKSYGRLRDIDESLTTGKILGFTKAVPYSREAALQYVDAKCKQNRERNNMAAYGMRVSNLLQFYIPDTENAGAVRDAKNNLIADATNVVLANGTTVEKSVFLNSGTYDFDTYYVPAMQKAIQNGVMDAQAGYDYMMGAADKYAGENYLGNAAIIADYDKVYEEYAAKADVVSKKRANYDKLLRDRAEASRNGNADFLMETRSQLETSYAELQQLEGDPELKYLKSKLDEMQPDYDKAMQMMDSIQKYYDRADKIAKLGGVKQSSSTVTNALAIASGFTQYRPTNWTADMVYDVMESEGYAPWQITNYTDKTIKEGQTVIANINGAIATMEARGIAIPDSIRENMERFRDEIQRSVDSAKYYQIRNNEDFAKVVAEEKKKIQEAERSPLRYAASIFMGNDAPAGEYDKLDLAAAVSDIYNYSRDGALQYDMGFLTQAEKDTYLYLRATQGGQAAYQYYVSKTGQYGVTNVRKSQDIDRAIEEITAGGIIGDTAATMITVAGSLCNSQGFFYTIGNTIAGKEVNPYDDAFAWSHFNGGVRAKNKEDIQTLFKDNPAVGTILSAGYDVVTSAADSATNMAVFGPVAKVFGSAGGAARVFADFMGTANMAAGAGAGTARDYALKGAPNWKVLAMTGVSFFSESITEMLPFDKLMKAKDTGAFLGGMKSFMGAVKSQIVTEGLEEGTSSLITGIADMFIMQDESEFAQNVTQYQKEGMDERSSYIAATYDSLKSILGDMVVGGLSGGFSASVTGGAQLYSQRRSINRLNNSLSFLPGKALLFADPETGAINAYQNTYDNNKNTPDPKTKAELVAERESLNEQLGAAEQALRDDPNDTETQKTKQELEILIKNLDRRIQDYGETGGKNTTENYTPELASYDIGDLGYAPDVDAESDTNPSLTTPETGDTNQPAPETGDVDQPAPETGDVDQPAPEADDPGMQPPADEMPQEAGPQGGKKPLVKKVVLLSDAASSGNKFALNAALSVVLSEEGNPGSLQVGIAAADKLISEYGAKRVAEVLTEIMLSNDEANIVEALLAGIGPCALSGENQSDLDRLFLMGDTSPMTLLNIGMHGTTYAINDKVAAAINQKAQQAVLDHRVAQKMVQMIGDGALAGLTSYQSAVAQAEEALRAAEERSAKQEEKVQSVADTLSTLAEQYSDDPTNPGLESAVSHAVAELEGELTVQAEYDEAKTKAENKLREVENTSKTMTDKTMAEVRQQAAAEVAAEMQAAEEAKAQAAQQEYDDAVAQYKPELPAGSTIPVTSPDGSQSYDIIGASFFAINPATGNAELYFTTKTGDVVPASMLSEEFADSVLNGLSAEQTTALMKKAPKYPMAKSVHLVNNATGAIEIATGFGIAPNGTVYFTTVDGKRHRTDQYTLENSSDQSHYDYAYTQAITDAFPIQQAHNDKKELDDAVAKYKPAMDFEYIEHVTTLDGENKKIVGVAFATETAPGEYDIYFQMSDGSVMHQSSFDDAFVDKYQTLMKAHGSFDQAAQMAPEHALESSIPVMNTSGKYHIVGVTEAADGTTKLVSSEGDLFKPSEVYAMDGFYQDELDNAVKDFDASHAAQSQPSQQAEPPTQAPTANQSGPQLESWQDPKYHGKVKAPKKLQTNTKNFQKWFSDPSGDLTNPDGTPKVIYRGTTSKIYMEHKAGSQHGSDHVLNFYSPDVSITKSYAGGQTHEIKTYDIVNWETAEAAMAAEGYELRKEQNSNGDWGYRAYGVKSGTQGHKGDFYKENELDRFNKEYGKVKKAGMYKGYLSLKKPLVIDAGGAPYESVKATVTGKDGITFTKTQSNRMWGEWARKNGYDACIVRNVKDQLSPSENHKSSTKPGTVIMTFSSTNFKSYWNTGKLGVKNDDIRYKAAPGTYALTGKALSPEFNTVTAKLAAGGDVTVDDIMNLPEVRYAEEHNVPGEFIPWREGGYTEDEIAEMTPPERASLENDIIDELMNRGCAIIDKNGNVTYDGNVRHDKRLDIIIGPPAAGKSTALANPLSYQYGARILDSDDVKTMLPEYNNGLGSNYLHQESRYVWKKMQDRAISGGDNVVLPIVGHNADSVIRDIQKFKEAGYSINMHYLELDGKKAIGRALSRLASDGRYIGFDYLYKVSMGGKINNAYEQLKGSGLIDGYSHWSNDVAYGEKPILLESSGYEATGKLGEQLPANDGMGSRSEKVPDAGRGRLHSGMVQRGVPGTSEEGTHYLKISSQNNGNNSENQNSSGKVTSPVQIANTLVNKLGVGNYIGKKGGTPPKALGYYQRHADLIGVRPTEAGRYTTTMHEAFHAIAERVSMTGTPDMIGKLAPAFKQNYDVSELPDEAFAEFGWMYMSDESLARAFAGDAFYTQFERALRSAGIYDAVVEARDNLRAFNAAKADAQIEAVMRDQSESGKKKRTIKEWARMFTSDAIDQSAAAEGINKEIRKQQKAAGKTDYNKVSLSEDVRAQSLLRNHSGKRAWYLTTENLTDVKGNIIGKSLATRFEEAGVTGKDFKLLNEYMLALHSLDRDAQGKVVFDNSAVTHQKRLELINDVQANHPEIVAAEKAFQAFRNEFLQAWGVDTGMISQEQLDRWNRMYPHYVPTRRVKAGDFASGQGSQHFEVYQATGSTEDVITPMDSFVSMINGLVSDVMSNNVGLALEQAYNHYEGMGIFARRVPSPGGANTIDVVHSDGSHTYYQINNKELYQLIANQNERVQKDLIHEVGKLTRLMTGLTTGSNPIFAATNFMRDFQNSVNYGSWASNYLTGAAKWLMAARDVWTKGGEYQDYAALGGGGWARIDTRTSKGSEEYRAALLKGYGTDTVGGKAKKAASATWGILTLERLNEVIEQTSRYAEYKYGKHDKSTDAGKQEAFLAGQDVTVDFTRAGNAAYAKTLRQVVPFLNASAQGSYRTGRMFTEAERSRLPARFAKTVINTGLSSTIASLLLLKFMDDKDKEDFANMSDDMKAQNFYLPNPSTEIFGEQPLVRIPIEQDPLAYFIHGMVTNAIWNGQTDDPIVIDLMATAEQMITNMIPLDNGFIWDPVIDVATNESWYGSNIVPTRMDGWDPSTQYTEETPGLFVQLGRMTGVSPMKIQYLAQQYSGFVGQIGIPAASAWQTDGPMAALKAAVGVAQKRLTSDPMKSSQVINGVYEGDGALQAVVKAGKNNKPMNMLRRGLTPEQAGEAYDEAKALTSSSGIVGQTKKYISEGYNKIDEINARTDLSDHEKYLLTRDVRRDMAEQALIANEAIGAFKEKYLVGENIVVKTLTNMTEGTTARIKNDAERLDQIFLNDSDAEYMQRTMEVWDSTGKATSLPGPQQTFEKTTNGVKQKYTVPEIMWDGYVDAYQKAYEATLMGYRNWTDMSADEKAAAVQKARQKGNDAAKNYYFNNID